MKRRIEEEALRREHEAIEESEESVSITSSSESEPACTEEQQECGESQKRGDKNKTDSRLIPGEGEDQGIEPGEEKDLEVEVTFSMDTDFWRTLKDPNNEVNRLRRKIKQLRKDLERHEKV